MARVIRAWTPSPLPVPAGTRSGRGRGGMRPPRARTAPMELYRQQSDILPLAGTQAQAVCGASGTVTLSVGPSGAGTVWYPASCVVSTSLGALADVSTCNVYIGPAAIPVTLQGSLYSGNGVVALALPSMSPGLTIIAQWTGETSGVTCAMNVTGTYLALTRGQSLRSAAGTAA
jgi:hypothetical protein